MSGSRRPRPPLPSPPTTTLSAPHPLHSCPPRPCAPASQYQQGPAPDFDRQVWFDEKFSLGLDFPNLPYLIDHAKDVKLTQSMAIMRYIAGEIAPKLLARTLIATPQTEDSDVCFSASPLRVTNNDPQPAPSWTRTLTCWRMRCAAEGAVFHCRASAPRPLRRKLALAVNLPSPTLPGHGPPQLSRPHLLRLKKQGT